MSYRPPTLRKRNYREYGPELISIHALNPYFDYNSPSRGIMFGSHFSQRPVIEGSEPGASLSGVEEEFGKYTFNVAMPEDGTIIAKIEKFPPTMTGEQIGFNPETLVIYRSHDTGQFGCFTVPYYSSHDPVFGFKYDIKENYSRIAPHAEIEKGTIFADSPAVKGESHYTYTKNLNIAYMSHSNVGLDGFVICEDVLPYFKFRVYEKRVVEFGVHEFPLNTYGNDHRYQGFPEMGEYLKESGLLCVLRKRNNLMSGSLNSIRDCQRVDHIFDNPIYVRPGKGRVVDITVLESNNTNHHVPDQITAQLQKYKQAGLHFHQEIMRFYDQQCAADRRMGGTGKIKVSRELNRLIIVARAILRHKDNIKKDLTLGYKKKPLDVWRLEFTIEYEITPTRGFKFSCQQGGKGVISRIEKRENMPVDSDGNSADIISGPDSIPGRMNLGRLWGPYFNGVARDVRKEMLEIIGLPRNFNGKLSMEDMAAIPPEKLEQAADRMLLLYSISSETSYHEYLSLTGDEKLEWLQTIFNDRLYNIFPIDKTGEFSEMLLEMEPKFLKEVNPSLMKHVESLFNITYGPVSYVGHSGIRKTTRNNVRIAPIPIMLLDKIADSWLAADIGKHSNFGILAATNRSDRTRRSWRKTTPRLIGETEGRAYVSYGGRLMLAELLERNGNLRDQRVIAQNIVEAQDPSDIEKLVSRAENPFGDSRQLQILNHFFYCMGVRMKYVPEKSS